MTELSYDMASEIAHAITTAAEPYGPVAFCVLDTYGHTVISGNMGVADTYEKLARVKALTALRHQQDTIEFRYQLDGDAWTRCSNWDEFDILQATQHDPDFCGFAGGIVMRIHSVLVGSIGVSALSEQDDDKVARDGFANWMITPSRREFTGKVPPPRG